jgi:hypothetical protein
MTTPLDFLMTIADTTHVERSSNRPIGKLTFVAVQPLTVNRGPTGLLDKNATDLVFARSMAMQIVNQLTQASAEVDSWFAGVPVAVAMTCFIRQASRPGP